MSNARIKAVFDNLKESGRHGLMAHVVAGYPSMDVSEKLIETLAGAGADLIEIQIPFTDPLADGPTIMAANQKSLAAGTRVADCFRFAEKMSAKLPDTPLLFMTYVNIPFNYGMEAFCRDASRAGVCGLIVPDIPPEETAERYHENALASGLDPIYILSPSSTDNRLEVIAEHARGFIYCTARVGTTGARDNQYEGLGSFIGRVKKYSDLPLALGFGIKTAEHVRKASQLVDMSIVGSRVIDIFNEASGEKEALEGVEKFIRSLKEV